MSDLDSTLNIKNAVSPTKCLFKLNQEIAIKSTKISDKFMITKINSIMEKTEYDIAIHNLRSLKNEHERLLTRIVGVTDVILSEQLQEECVDLEANISIAETKICDIEKKDLCSLFDEIKNEHIQFYKTQWILADPILCLEKTNNIQLFDVLKKHRLRIPSNMNQRRELCLIANELDYRITLLDYEGFQIDHIGKGTFNLYLHCNCFHRFDQTEFDSAMYHIN